jgi:MFS family permease
MDKTNAKPEGNIFAGMFRNLFVSTTVAAFGGSVSAVAVSIIVYKATHSAYFLGYLGIAGVVPGIALGLLAGVIADRYDRRKLMVTSDVVRMVSMAFLALFLHFVGFSFPLIIAVMVVVYSFSTFFQPASQAILPMLVNKQDLENANGMLQSSFSVFQSIGSGVGGIIVVYLGGVWGLGINSMTYALSAIFLFQIVGDFRSRAKRENPKHSSFLMELREGMRYMKEHLPILEGTLGFLPANFFGSFIIQYLLVYSSVKFSSASTSYGYLLAAISAGMALGAVLVGRIKGSRYAGILMGTSLLAASGLLLLFTWSDILYFSLALAAMFGILLGLLNTTYFSTVQAIVPTEILARVLSIDSVGSFAAIPAGIAVGAVLVTTYGVVFAYFVAGIGLLVNSVVVLSLREFRSFKYVP